MLIYGPGETTTTPKENQVNPNICTLYLVVISLCITYNLGKQDLFSAVIQLDVLVFPLRATGPRARQSSEKRALY